MTQKQAAKAIGVHWVSYIKWEKSGVQPKLQSRVEAAAKAFGVHFLWLATGCGPRRTRGAA